MTSWEETTKKIIDDLMEVFSSPETDVQSIEEMKLLTAQLNSALKSRGEDVKASIAALVKAGTDSGLGLPAPSGSAPFPTHLRVLSELKNGTAERVADLRARKTGAESRILELRRETDAVAQTMASLEADKVSQIPTVKHSISLYVNISNIRWDYDSSNVAGVILPAGGAPMKAFDIDPSSSSEFEITNQLWDLIAEAS